MLRTSLIAAIMLAMAATGTGQTPQTPPATPWKAKNLEFFPKDIGRGELVQRMREFSFALGVRCTHCHAGKDSGSLDDMVFDSDEKPAKLTARAMLRMVEQINTVSLAKLPSRAEPRVVVDLVLRNGVRLTLTRTWREAFSDSSGSPPISERRSAVRGRRLRRIPWGRTRRRHVLMRPREGAHRRNLASGTPPSTSPRRL
jgi:hypothetical protein